MLSCGMLVRVGSPAVAQQNRKKRTRGRFPHQKLMKAIIVGPLGELLNGGSVGVFGGYNSTLGREIRKYVVMNSSGAKYGKGAAQFRTRDRVMKADINGTLRQENRPHCANQQLVDASTPGGDRWCTRSQGQIQSVDSMNSN